MNNVCMETSELGEPYISMHTTSIVVSILNTMIIIIPHIKVKGINTSHTVL